MGKHETAADRRRQQEITVNLVIDDLDRMMGEVSGLAQFMRNTDPFVMNTSPELIKRDTWREAAGNIQAAAAALRLAKSGLQPLQRGKKGAR